MTDYERMLDMVERLNEFSMQTVKALQQSLEIMKEDRLRIAVLEEDANLLLAERARRPYGSRANPLKTRPRPWAMGLRRT